MTEPIDKWKGEHKQLLLATNKWCLANFQSSNGVYYCWELQASWEGYLMAKRSTPVVELPNANHIFFDTKLQEKGFVSAIEYVGEILEEAGINYRIKGE